jgi:hypothetical protein
MWPRVHTKRGVSQESSLLADEKLLASLYEGRRQNVLLDPGEVMKRSEKFLIWPIAGIDQKLARHCPFFKYRRAASLIR